LLSSLSIAMGGPCSAGPSVWNEGDGGQGDAGKFPAGANITAGSGGPLTTICGNLADATTGADMFEILITGSNFSALTADRAGSTLDPALYLFDSTGHALFGENDISGANVQAQITGQTITAGLYFLAIAASGQDPLHTGSQIFGSGFDTSTGIQTPLSGTPKLNTWNNNGNSSGDYRIALTGAEFAETPEPGALGLVGIGLVGLGWLRRRFT
jgi:hypothetical protein